MQWTFQSLQQIADVVERQPGLEIAEIPGSDLEWLTRSRKSPAGQAPAQCFIDDIAERSASTPRLRLEFGGNVFIKRQGGSHVLMLVIRHHDVNNAPPHKSGNVCARTADAPTP